MESQELANYRNRQGIGEVANEIDFLAATHLADEILDDRMDAAARRPHPLRGELGHDQAAQDAVIGRVAKQQGTMRFNDPVLDRIDDKVKKRVARPRTLKYRNILRTHP